jgi:hypothetical protein
LTPSLAPSLVAAWLTLGLQPDKDCQAPRLKPPDANASPRPRTMPGGRGQGLRDQERVLAREPWPRWRRVARRSMRRFTGARGKADRPGAPVIGMITVWGGESARLVAHLPRSARLETIETISLSRGNHFHANVCAPVELAPSRQATNGQRRYSCRALRSRYTPEL